MAIIRAEFMSLGSAQKIAQVAAKQLIDYKYTFPTVGKVERVLVKRTQPYRNARIITVIQGLYFDGGVNSVAHRFSSHFPMSPGPDGVRKREISIPMVALVATAVSISYFNQ